MNEKTKQPACCVSRFTSEQESIEHLRDLRWAKQFICPKNKCKKGYYFIKTRNIFKCRTCKEQFSVRTGTVFEESRVPLHKWFTVIYLMLVLKRTPSSVQVAKRIDVTQKTAWFMLQRIKHVFESKNIKSANFKRRCCAVNCPFQMSK